jgi:eukaryotic-like serine/threonine-protein kinase
MTTGEPAAWGGPEHGPKRLGGRYELGDLLGIGGMAVVRLATDLRLKRTVAVKMLRGELAESPAFQTRFRREARAAASLDHPAVVSVYDAGEDTVDGMVASYIVMEYVQGQTLRDVVRSGPVEARRALEITADVLDALATSHRNGIVHRDIKPANVMVTPSGDVKVMDFGVARAVADMSASLTQTSAVIGTAHYLSPEQARGESVDARSDVYSTGCLLYELLTGRPPFQGDSAIAVAYQHVREPAQPPSIHTPGLAPDIDSVVMGALAKHADERYQSAEQMRAGILAVLSGSADALPVGAAGTAAFVQAPTTEPDATVATTQENPVVGAEAIVPAGPGRRRRLALVAATVALLLIAVGAFALTELSGEQPQVGQQAEQRAGRGDDGDRQRTSPAQVAPAPADVAESESTGVGDDDRARRAQARPQRADDGTDASEPPQDPDRAPRVAPEPTADPEPASTEPEPSPEETTPEDTASETAPAPSPEPEPTPTATSSAAAGDAS